MLVTTHMLIGEKVYQNIHELFKTNLCKSKFIYGNIKPDLVYELSSKSHCIDDSLDFVLEEVNQLILSQDYKEEFSVKLGIINHFLSDFFCSPHYFKDNFNGLMKHLNYELHLHKVFKAMENNNLLKIYDLRIDNFLKDNLLNTIFYLENDYKKQRPSIENDIIFALRAATLSSIHILNNFLIETSKKAA